MSYSVISDTVRVFLSYVLHILAIYLLEFLLPFYSTNRLLDKVLDRVLNYWIAGALIIVVEFCGDTYTLENQSIGINLHRMQQKVHMFSIPGTLSMRTKDAYDVKEKSSKNEDVNGNCRDVRDSMELLSLGKEPVTVSRSIAATPLFFFRE